jgi:hypothetical protein
MRDASVAVSTHTSWLSGTSRSVLASCGDKGQAYTWHYTRMQQRRTPAAVDAQSKWRA